MASPDRWQTWQKCEGHVNTSSPAPPRAALGASLGAQKPWGNFPYTDLAMIVSHTIITHSALKLHYSCDSVLSAEMYNHG